MLAYKDFGGQGWTLQDTGISPSTADSALTAGYQYEFWGGKIFLAWTRYDGSIYYTTRNLGGGWVTPQSIPAVISTHAPVIAVGSDVRLFYPNAATGSLSYLVWNGASWGSPVHLTSVVGPVGREPAVTWDGSHFVVLFVAGPDAEVQYIEITPGVGGGADSYSSPVSFHECAYTTGPHSWSGQITSAFQSGKLYLLGFREGMDLHQAAMTKEAQQWKFWHHAYTERVGEEIVVRAGAPGLYAALWSYDPNGSSASIFSR